MAPLTSCSVPSLPDRCQLLGLAGYRRAISLLELLVVVAILSRCSAMAFHRDGVAMSTYFRVRIGSAIACGAFAALLATLPIPSVTAQDPDKLLSEVRQASEKRQASAQTAKITWTHRETLFKGSMSVRFPPPLTKASDIHPPQDATHEGSGIMLLNGDQARISRTSMVWHLSRKRFHKDQTESVIKGTQYTSLIHYGSQEWPQGRLSKDGWRNDAEILIWPALMALRGVDDRVVREAGIKSYTAARRLVVDGRPSVEITRERTETQGESKLLVDDSPGYPIRRIDTFQRDGNLATRIIIVANKTIDGLAYPVEWKISTFRNRTQLDSTHVQVNSLDLHPTLTGGDFSLDFPVGTYVIDTQTNTMQEYIVREDGSKRVVLPEERGAGYHALVNSETGGLAGGSSWGSRGSLLLTIVGGLLVLGAGVFAVVRWQRRRLSETR